MVASWPVSSSTLAHSPAQSLPRTLAPPPPLFKHPQDVRHGHPSISKPYNCFSQSHNVHPLMPQPSFLSRPVPVASLAQACQGPWSTSHRQQASRARHCSLAAMQRALSWVSTARRMSSRFGPSACPTTPTRAPWRRGRPGGRSRRKLIQLMKARESGYSKANMSLQRRGSGLPLEPLAAARS